MYVEHIIKLISSTFVRLRMRKPSTPNQDIASLSTRDAPDFELQSRISSFVPVIWFLLCIWECGHVFDGITGVYSLWSSKFHQTPKWKRRFSGIKIRYQAPIPSHNIAKTVFGLVPLSLTVNTDCKWGVLIQLEYQAPKPFGQ